MTSDTLFTVLVRRFRQPAEVLATAGLGYILERSEAAGEALRAIADRCGAPVSDHLIYRAQVAGDDGAIPDLAGARPAGPPEIIVEGKFWAGLTEHQPATYLYRLPAARPGILVFVAPSARIEILWPTVVDRCPPDSAPLGPETLHQDELRAIRLASGHVLAVTSWRFVLEEFSRAVHAAGGDDLVADIAQLLAFCEAQDREAFLPLRLEEVTNQQFARRIVDYYGLPAEITSRAAHEGLVSTKGLRSARSGSRFGSYSLLGRWGISIVVDPDLWARYGQGPLWLLFHARVAEVGGEWESDADWRQLENELGVFREAKMPGPKLILLDGRPALGLRLSMYVEREEVISDVVEQLRWISRAVGPEAPPIDAPISLPDGSTEVG